MTLSTSVSQDAPCRIRWRTLVIVWIDQSPSRNADADRAVHPRTAGNTYVHAHQPSLLSTGSNGRATVAGNRRLAREIDLDKFSSEHPIVFRQGYSLGSLPKTAK